jgi:hypothetical protein
MSNQSKLIGYSNDRSSAEALACSEAVKAVRSGECQEMRVVWALDALADAEGEEGIAAAEIEVKTAWDAYRAACL